MEWIEVTGRTIEEAKDALLDRLGVQEDEAEFEVLEEPKAGLFGRTRGQYRVRARVQPKSPRSKDDRRRRGGRQKSDRPAATSTPVADSAPKPPVKESRGETRAAAKPESRKESPAAERLATDVAINEATAFLQALIERFGLTADVIVEPNDDGDLEAAVTGSNLGRLIGPRGAMVRAVEELVRTRLQHAADGGSTPRLRLDIGGYRDLRRSTILEVTDEAMDAVRSSGTPHVLDVVLAGERKAVHDRVGEAGDLTTRSEGEDPNRRVVVLPAS